MSSAGPGLVVASAKRRTDESDETSQATEPAAGSCGPPRCSSSARGSSRCPRTPRPRPGRSWATSRTRSGARVPGAQVTATNLGTQFSRSTTTDAEGQYALRLLPLGSYKLEVTLTGFKTFSQTGILVEVGRNARIDATLEAGGIEEVVSVEADASLVETSSSALSRTVGQNEVLNLPLVNRDVYSLLSITGGVSSNDALELPGRPRSSSPRSTARRAPRSAASTSSSTAATTRRACAAPATPRRTRRRSRSSGSSRTATPRSTAATRPASWTSSRSRAPTSSTAPSYEYFRNESLNAERWAPPGVDAHEGPARPEPVRRRLRRADPARTRRSSSSATRACARRRPTTGTRRVVPTDARAGRRLLAVGDQAPGPDDRPALPGGHHPVLALRPGGR